MFRVYLLAFERGRSAPIVVEDDAQSEHGVDVLSVGWIEIAVVDHAVSSGWSHHSTTSAALFCRSWWLLVVWCVLLLDGLT